MKFVKMHKLGMKELIELERKSKIVWNGIEEFGDFAVEVLVRTFVDHATIYVVSETEEEDKWDVVEVMMVNEEYWN